MAKAADEILEMFGEHPAYYAAWYYDVDITAGCWMWRRSVDGSGYGNLCLKGRMWRAHRLFYFLGCGEHPGRAVVMHTCDTPRCVNPDHLILGTQHDNIRDRHEKGRNGACRGEDAPWSRLTAERVHELRARFSGGENRASLAADFGISKTQMYRVVNRESWRHL